eukprot:CAMPEP_0181175638 /NCGR_PEP_ID=MMETSP1096-20121128/4189_1 /TAXON_ID=156174 ORGANISM="Chrysochromulina ericina, Strain CCMP281" /NCGR_SAMPLE_ID=MMETSP1096 /ASSEMBLY_ACC=CAM_ASM_000453 /LENGTH=217 /DNA_ID=CAMNT_0023263645 /DNA_START=306 /DNA_END=954 /DNA_ORIENTATION=-
MIHARPTLCQCTIHTAHACVPPHIAHATAHLHAQHAPSWLPAHGASSPATSPSASTQAIEHRVESRTHIAAIVPKVGDGSGCVPLPNAPDLLDSRPSRDIPDLDRCLLPIVATHDHLASVYREAVDIAAVLHLQQHIHRAERGDFHASVSATRHHALFVHRQVGHSILVDGDYLRRRPQTQLQPARANPRDARSAHALRLRTQPGQRPYTHHAVDPT